MSTRDEVSVTCLSNFFSLGICIDSNCYSDVEQIQIHSFIVSENIRSTTQSGRIDSI